MAGYTDNRDFNVDRPRDGARRVEPLEESDRPAAATDGHEQRAEDIARMAEAALSNSRLKILQDDTSGDYIYLLVDQDTGETVRRWPPEKHGDLLEYLRTRQAGLIDRLA